METLSWSPPFIGITKYQGIECKAVIASDIELDGQHRTVATLWRNFNGFWKLSAEATFSTADEDHVISLVNNCKHFKQAENIDNTDAAKQWVENIVETNQYIDPTERNELLRLLCVNARMVYRCLLSGALSIAQETIWAEIRNPKVGDLVLEITSRKKDEYPIGRLLAKYYVQEENDTIYVIATLDGVEERWHNADFIKVFEA